MRLFSGLRIRSRCCTRARLCRCLRLSRAALVVGRRQGRVVLPPGIVGMECPSSNVFDEEATDEHEEIYADKLTNKQVADGFLPWTDTFDLDEFYQYPIESKFVKKGPKGWTLNKMKRTLIRKHKPFHQL